MRNKLSTVCIVLGTALVLAALFLFISNAREADIAQLSSANALERVVTLIEQQESVPDSVPDFPSLPQTAAPEPLPAEMAVTEIDGYEYIGFVSIPALELELPVMADWDYTRLRKAPCRYSGSYLTDDLVIAAHNYNSHFGRLSTLSIGDDVYFTDMDGNTHAYTASELTTMEASAVEEMCSGAYALTLFTCTYGGASRIALRCAAQN